MNYRIKTTNLSIKKSSGLVNTTHPSQMTMPHSLMNWHKIPDSVSTLEVVSAKFVCRSPPKERVKSGGARVITFTVIVSMEESEINLLYIYDKADRPSISTHEIERLLHKNGLR